MGLFMLSEPTRGSDLMRTILFALLLVPACSKLSEIGKEPSFSPAEGSYQHHAMYTTPMPEFVEPSGPTEASSLWTAKSGSLFGDRRAGQRGDILTVVIEIDDKAEISNSSDRNRNGSNSMAIPSLF
jgi:flagellar L-ring protein precursor FlgH